MVLKLIPKYLTDALTSWKTARAFVWKFQYLLFSLKVKLEILFMRVDTPQPVVNICVAHSFSYSYHCFLAL